MRWQLRVADPEVINNIFETAPSHEIVKDDFRELALEDDAKETLEKVIFPALKQLLLPPAGLDDDACIDTLTTLERLYRQFERC